MEGQLFRHPSHISFGDNDIHAAGRGNPPRAVWSPVDAVKQSAFHEELDSFGNYSSSIKRQREHHVIIDSSQDDEDFDYDDQHDDHSMMDCENDDIGPKKRRRLDYNFVLNNSSEPFRIGQQRQVEMNDYAGRNLTSTEMGKSPLEWWRKPRSPANINTSIGAAIHSKALVQQETPSPCSAMDTSGCDHEICCHICRKRFPLPSIPSVSQVMPANALLNYFTPLNKKGNPNGDVAMTLSDSHSTQRDLSPACCSCCDRPSCPDCQRDCDVCQKSFCSFCSIDGEGSSCLCLDCNHRLR